MALSPQFTSRRIAGHPGSTHTLELYIDYVCPFSAKIVKSVSEHMIPLLKEKGREDALSILIRPWHHSSTFVHQAAVAVSTLTSDWPNPQAVFWKFTQDLMDAQKEFFDERTVSETPKQTKERLAELAVKSVGVDKASFLKAVESGEGNKGTMVDLPLKLAIKYGRQNGIHVTPTAAFDGLIDDSVLSSFGKAEWENYLDTKVL